MTPEQPLRAAARRRLVRLAPLGAALAIAALLTACGPTYPRYQPPAGWDDPAQVRINYLARHREMLDTVLERPGRIEALLAEQERQRRVRARQDWDRIRARQQAYQQVQQRQQQGSVEQFLLIIERQRALNESRERDRTEGWAQFLEKRVGYTGNVPEDPAP